MLAIIQSAALRGIDGQSVQVEVHVSPGLPAFSIVGLPDASCREAAGRVRAAVLSSGLVWPAHRITVNLAPTTVRKAGSGLDLAIAMGVLQASGQLDQVTPDTISSMGFVGELGLDGTLRPVTGTVPIVDSLWADAAVVPVAAAAEARIVGRHKVYAVENLRELVAALQGDEPWPAHREPPLPPPPPPPPDLRDVRGQVVGRQAVEIAAAGGHHLLFMGPPGSGKTMLARRLPGLLPPLTPEQSIAVTRVHSAAGMPLPGGLITVPPFRAPHHSATMVSLVGGGTSSMRPGEISLANHGVLFLDEMGEYRGDALEALRQPLEEGVVRVARAHASVSYPARLLLVAATNPCPCGEANQPGGGCRCTEGARERYRRRLSGPLLDRFDLRVDVTRSTTEELLHAPPGEPTAAVIPRVAAARARAADRGVRCNAELDAAQTEALTPLTGSASRMLESALKRGQLSARGLARLRRVALTIADLSGHDGPLDIEHVAQALELRSHTAVASEGRNR